MKSSVKITAKFDKELLSLISADLKCLKKTESNIVAQLENIRAAKLVA